VENAGVEHAGVDKSDAQVCRFLQKFRPKTIKSLLQSFIVWKLPAAKLYRNQLPIEMCQHFEREWPHSHKIWA